MVDFEFLIRKTEASHTHLDIELFYVMDGTVRFTVEGKEYVLGRSDFLIVNVDNAHSYTAENDILAACMHISYSELTSMMKQSMVFFWCNTTLGYNEACDELRRVIQKIISEQYRNQGKNVIYLKSLYFEMLNILTSDFLLNKEDTHFREEAHKFDARRHEIEEYIRLNFDRQISLEDLANHLYLSYAYLSKYIKRQFGMGFAEYLNGVRLNFAVSQLLHSDQSVVRIAMESGFSSSASLNKAFREKYGMTPTEYRKRWSNKRDVASNSEEEERDIREHLKRHFAENRQQSARDKKLPEETVVLNTGTRHVLKKSWNKMINMGTVTDLLQSEMQRHVLYLKDELHFQYIRFWDLYSEELYMDAGETGYNFDKLDRVLDFLIRNGLKPYIDLGCKFKRIIRNLFNDISYKENSAFTDDAETVERFLRRFMIHILNRYHTDEVETWYFELWHTEPAEVYQHPSIAAQAMSIQQYLDRFDMVSGVLREYVPTIRLGGGGFSMRYGQDIFRETLEEWKKRRELPNFITCYSYPYTQDTVERVRSQSRNADLMREQLQFIRKTLAETDFPTQEIHITEWNFSVSNRNVLNDHCMKGAYLVRNMIDSVNMADIMGYWVGSDLFAAHHSSHAPINGSAGLLSKDGIRKPAYYAFDFMDKLGKYVRKRDEHYIITDNASGNYRIVCHNLKNLSYQYTMKLEDEVPINEQNNLFTDMHKHKIHFDLPGRRAGKYTIRVYSLNQSHGSLQDEWLAMSAPNELWREELKYLSRITTPHMAIRTCVAENGRITFDIVMEPNEIDYIHVTYQYS